VIGGISGSANREHVNRFKHFDQTVSYQFSQIDANRESGPVLKEGSPSAHLVAMNAYQIGLPSPHRHARILSSI
jgi:hypothetical protein